ncbi:hypothetical protein AVEN_42442-1 [Araneus ventricosus]|uniref:Uncharacterized protein n=1 Tax=Araneus ventricosus TaxID=182803 RepID=A0A4Y2N2V9_ARAVE|nr:hypothetical protein AVEN_42442-1 [Araneus ventricosus]
MDGPRHFEPRSEVRGRGRHLSWHPPSPNFRERLATTYDLACNRPHTRRIFSGIGFRTCDPPAPGSRPYHQANASLFFCRNHEYADEKSSDK